MSYRRSKNFFKIFYPLALFYCAFLLSSPEDWTKNPTNPAEHHIQRSNRDQIGNPTKNHTEAQSWHSTEAQTKAQTKDQTGHQPPKIKQVSNKDQTGYQIEQPTAHPTNNPAELKTHLKLKLKQILSPSKAFAVFQRRERPRQTGTSRSFSIPLREAEVGAEPETPDSTGGYADPEDLRTRELFAIGNDRKFDLSIPEKIPLDSTADLEENPREPVAADPVAADSGESGSSRSAGYLQFIDTQLEQREHTYHSVAQPTGRQSPAAALASLGIEEPRVVAETAVDRDGEIIVSPNVILPPRESRKFETGNNNNGGIIVIRTTDEATCEDIVNGGPENKNKESLKSDIITLKQAINGTNSSDAKTKQACTVKLTEYEAALAKLDEENKDEDLCNVESPIGKSRAQLNAGIEDLNLKIANLNTLIQDETDTINSTTAPEDKKNEARSSRSNLRADKNKCDIQLRAYKAALAEQKETGEVCKESYRNLEEVYRDFNKACSEFAGGSGMKCASAIEACAHCPQSGTVSNYDCVQIHTKAQCPELSGEELTITEEKIEEIEGKEKDLKDQIEDLSEDITEKENDLHEDLQQLEEEFAQSRQELDREVEAARGQLEQDLLKRKGQISGKLSEALAKVQERINNSLRMLHSIENATTKANREFRAENRAIRRECRKEAEDRLTKYRQSRQKAVESGSLRISPSQLLSRGRTSFSQRDQNRLKYYLDFCLKNSKGDFNDNKEDHRMKLRQIEQLKEQHMEGIQQLKNQMQDMHEQAMGQERLAVQQYERMMNQSLTSHKAKSLSLFESHNKKQAGFMRAAGQIHGKKVQGMQKASFLRNTRQDMEQLRHLMARLKQQGVTDDGNENEGEFNEALSAKLTLREKMSSSLQDCACLNLEDYDDECSTSSKREDNPSCNENQNCSKIRDKEKRLMDVFRYEEKFESGGNGNGGTR